MKMYVLNNPPNCAVYFQVSDTRNRNPKNSAKIWRSFQKHSKFSLKTFPSLSSSSSSSYKIQNQNIHNFTTSLSLSLSRSLSDLIVLELVLNTERKSSTIFLRIPANLRYFSISKLPSLISTKCFSLSLSRFVSES